MNDHNNPPSLLDDEDEKAPEALNETGQQLRAYIERIERMEEEKAGIQSGIKDIFASAKGNGFDVKTMRQILKIRKMDASDRAEQEVLIDTYLAALGML